MKKLLITLFGAALLVALIMMGLSSSEQMAEKAWRAGVLMVGSWDDSSWNEAHRDGIEKAAEKLGIQLVYEENVTSENCTEVMEHMIKEGCNIIISTSISFEEGVEAVARKHHDVNFLQATGSTAMPNMAPYMGRMYQARYLAGIVAGRCSKSHAVGYVATVQIPEVIRGIDAFTLGVRRANPNANVYVTYTDSWSDDKSATKKTEELLEQVPEIDVIGMHLDTYGPIHVARERGIQAIGCNIMHQEDEDVLLTAVIWNWDTLYSKYLKEAIQGRLTARNYLVGIETGIVDLAPLSSRCDEETKRMTEEAREQLVTGDMDVFYGPVYDQQGNLKIAEGESLPDKKLLEQLDWYVEGVKIYEADVAAP